MRVLILGGTGMLGHKLYQHLDDAFVTVRSQPRDLQRLGLYCPDQIVAGVQATDIGSVERAIDRVGPDAVVNCIGIVKQHPLASDPAACTAINAEFPHLAARACRERGVRFVHVSTDCVFDGQKGNYNEQDSPNATDIYGQTKALGEVTGKALTLRTSIVGREIANGTGFVEWFLSNRGGSVKGFTNAVFSGVTTQELSRVIANVLHDHPTLTGLYHVASTPIDKCSLAKLLNERFETKTAIEPDGALRLDRSLDGALFCERTGYVAPAWTAMAAEMASDPTPYDNWKTL